MFGIPGYLELIQAFDYACAAKDLKAARRISAKIFVKVHPDKPLNIAHCDAMMRTYAAEIHGWEID